MSGVLNFLTKIFGNKYDSDINKLKPIIENINAEVKSLSNLSNDELRDITHQLKLEIKENTQELNKKIDNLKQIIEDKKNENEAEKIFKEIDDIEKQILFNIYRLNHDPKFINQLAKKLIDIAKSIDEEEKLYK